MPSADYTTIQIAIEDESTTTPSQALEGTYKDDPAGNPRRFLAYALGDGILGSDTEEVVLGWQYAGHHTDSDPNKNWRCFKVASFTGPVGSKLTSIAFSSPLTPPLPLTPKERERQKCVLQGISGQIIHRKVKYHT
ncbi:MAG TPA: hypothetical protein VGK58_24950 [Lacipirellulaceae bacterium]